MEFARRNKEGAKMPITPYLVYVQERREELKGVELNLEPKEFINGLSQEWKSMTEEEKRPYIEKAEANRLLRKQNKNC